jgi:nitrite reductase (cytochrome c-552)
MPPGAEPPETRRTSRWRPIPRSALLAALGLGLLVAVGISLLLVTIGERRAETRHPYQLLVAVDDDVTDPAVWGVNWPSQWDSYLRTTDWERTRYGGSDAIPTQKLESQPWLRAMWSGYAFSIDYRESRGHAYTLHDQDHTQRVIQRPQPARRRHYRLRPRAIRCRRASARARSGVPM